MANDNTISTFSNMVYESKDDTRTTIAHLGEAFQSAYLTVTVEYPKAAILINEANTLPSGSEAYHVLHTLLVSPYKEDVKLVLLTIYLLNSLKEPQGLFLWRVYFSPSHKNTTAHEGYSKSSYYRNINQGIESFLRMVSSNPESGKVYASHIKGRDDEKRHDLDEELKKLK